MATREIIVIFSNYC